MTRYIVIVYPAPSQPSPTATISWTAGASGPRVERVGAADSPGHAVKKVKIQPGEHAYVVDESHCRRFDRAAVAPLVERMVDGNPLPFVETGERAS